ncbi:hypothetical protein [Sandaracinus amylolyticus]|uniref:hypothetical protein n=1 Tax=Sandaracinus amylolyticus TaxID=927083 RepID=UPI001F3E1A51|nr:hypothetical protein [Sandaracinus amylolyticus]
MTRRLVGEHAAAISAEIVARPRRAPVTPPKTVISIAPMSAPQDSPTRKKQKARRRKKLARWREKQAAAKAAGAKG